jgi:hypothetical protein
LGAVKDTSNGLVAGGITAHKDLLSEAEKELENQNQLSDAATLLVQKYYDTVKAANADLFSGGKDATTANIEDTANIYCFS